MTAILLARPALSVETASAKSVGDICMIMPSSSFTIRVAAADTFHTEYVLADRRVTFIGISITDIPRMSIPTPTVTVSSTQSQDSRVLAAKPVP